MDALDLTPTRRGATWSGRDAAWSLDASFNLERRNDDEGLDEDGQP
jgi:hypothetical protein